MKKIRLIGLVAAATAITATTSTPTQQVDQQLIALERAALVRWGNGDPDGFLETYAPEVTYFDPFTEKRMDGVAILRQRYAPMKGTFKVDSFAILNPKVQGTGDTRVLSYNLLSRSRVPGTDSVRTAHWNSSTVYGRVGGTWKILHSHWSFTMAGGTAVTP